MLHSYQVWKGDKNPAPPFTRLSFFFLHRSSSSRAHIYIISQVIILTWLVVGPLDSVSVVGGVQLVGDQFERKNLFVDLHIGSRDVNLDLRIALLGCQPVPNNLKKPDMRYWDAVFEGDC